MTRKLLTLLTFALLGIGSVWAVDFTCSADLSSVTSANRGEGSVDGINCTLTWYKINSGTYDYNGTTYWKFDNGTYAQLKLASGSFQAGDVLTVGMLNQNSSKKEIGYCLKSSSGNVAKQQVNGQTAVSMSYTLVAADIDDDGTIKIFRGGAAASDGRFYSFSVSGTRATETFTVTFNAGTNGTCGTASLTEESVGAGVTLPAVTANDGYVFNGWFTAATEGTKAGNAGALYMPTANVTLYAQYSALAAPTINIANTNVSTPRGSSVTLTATVTGSPAPTVTWYKNETATKTGGTQVGTGSTYNPDVTVGGTFYYYAVASNGIGNDAVSDVVTLEVTNPDKTIDGNAYYVTEDELAIPGQNIICDDITMQYSDGSYSKAKGDNTVSDLVSGFVASVDCATNGWGVTFTPSKPGALKVGVVINKEKTFTITNVTGFSYQSKNPDGSGTISSNTWTPTDKQYSVITIKVVPGTSYKFSVGGSKMGFYGFEFTPVSEVSGTITASGYNTYSSNYPLDLSTISGGIAYVATGIENGKVILTKCTGKVPAATGLFIAGTADAPFTIATTSEATIAPAANLLVGMPNGGQVAKADDGEYNYVFGWTDVTNPGFYLVNGTLPTLGAFKAYLHTTDALDAPSGSRLALSFGGATTGIDEAVREAADSRFFDLQGRSVAQPQKGLYIVNGKKVIIK